MTLKKWLLSVLSITLFFTASPIYANTPTPLRDVPYQFDSVKLQASKDPFHFFRSFVDLFYLVYKANTDTLTRVTHLTNAEGWCVGDAHPENFGFQIQENRSTLFTMNDMDDSGPCPVVLDLYRFLVSIQLYNPQMDISPLIRAYAQGLESQNYSVPSVIRSMQQESLQKGIDPKSKKIKKNHFIRTGEMEEVSEETRSEIISKLSSFLSVSPAQLQVYDIVKTSKVGGGSSGLTRYEILLNIENQLLHLELKEQVTPAIYPVSNSIPDTLDRIKNTLLIDQGSQASRFYGVLHIQNRMMLLRPRFSGDVGVNLDKNSNSENASIINFEAYTLGLLHARSLGSARAAQLESELRQTSLQDWESEVSSMAHYMIDKSQSLTYKEATSPEDSTSNE